jgi:hypothetical protein
MRTRIGRSGAAQAVGEYLRLSEAWYTNLAFQDWPSVFPNAKFATSAAADRLGIAAMPDGPGYIEDLRFALAHENGFRGSLPETPR